MSSTLVIIPFRAFLHNITRDDQLATSQRTRACGLAGSSP
jgi:hypothetical protein